MNKQPICVFKNGREFPGWLYAQLIKRYGYEMAPQILFKTRNKDKPVGYCMRGMKEGWLADMTLEMERNKPYMEAWIAKNIHREAPAPKIKTKPTKRKYKTIGGKKLLVEKIGGRIAEPDSFADIAKGII